MSKEETITIKCPKCGKEGKYVVWHSLNSKLSPEAKEDLLSGKLFSYKCSDCGEVTSVIYDFLYHEMDEYGTMIQLASSDENYNATVKNFDMIVNNQLMPEMPNMAEKYRFRIVDSVNNLREKVYIFDQGLDDRVIELMKIFIINSLNKSNPEISVSKILLGIADGEPEQFAVCLSDDKWGSVPFNRSLYDDLEKVFIKPDDDGRTEYVVNQEWAMKKLVEQG